MQRDCSPQILPRQLERGRGNSWAIIHSRARGPRLSYSRQPEPEAVPLLTNATARLNGTVWKEKTPEGLFKLLEFEQARMLKDQRLQKRGRVVNRAKNPRTGRGRDDDSDDELSLTSEACVGSSSESQAARARALARERQLRDEAAAAQRRSQQEQRAAELQLARVVLEKRELLASGDVRTATSHQGIIAMAHPTVEERATLVRTLYLEPHPQLEPGLELELEPEPEMDPGPWPTLQDQVLLNMANDQLSRGDFCAALLLAKWATCTIDTTKHSVTYQKPKLAAKIAHLQELANSWLARHAAYLPLFHGQSTSAAAADRGSNYAKKDSTQDTTSDDLGLALATRKLALAMSLLPRLGTDSPLAEFLDYDPLRRVGRQLPSAIMHVHEVAWGW
jgi:hypothetical protein